MKKTESSNNLTTSSSSQQQYPQNQLLSSPPEELLLAIILDSSKQYSTKDWIDFHHYLVRPLLSQQRYDGGKGTFFEHLKPEYRLAIILCTLLTRRLEFYSDCFEMFKSWEFIGGAFWIVEEEILRHAALGLISSNIQKAKFVKDKSKLIDGMDKILSREEIHHRILQEKILQLRDSLHHLLEDIFKAYHMEEPYERYCRAYPLKDFLHWVLDWGRNLLKAILQQPSHQNNEEKKKMKKMMRRESHKKDCDEKKKEQKLKEKQAKAEAKVKDAMVIIDLVAEMEGEGDEEEKEARENDEDNNNVNKIDQSTASSIATEKTKSEIMENGGDFLTPLQQKRQDQFQSYPHEEEGQRNMEMEMEVVEDLLEEEASVKTDRIDFAMLQEIRQSITEKNLLQRQQQQQHQQQQQKQSVMKISSPQYALILPVNSNQIIAATPNSPFPLSQPYENFPNSQESAFSDFIPSKVMFSFFDPFEGGLN